jgi:hypothetical protein
MKHKVVIGIIGSIPMFLVLIPTYNYYVSPIIRHKEIMDKIDGIDKRLKKIEK